MTPFATEKTYPHGTRASYVNNACRCYACRAANTTYARAYYRQVRSGKNDGRLVPAEPTRNHLLILSEHGVGKRRVHDLCGVSLTVIEAIRRGRRTRCRYRTQEAILGVKVDAGSLGTLTDASEAEAVITRLRAQGLPKYRIAAMLGSKAATPCLQVGTRPMVTRRTVKKLTVLEQLLLRGLVRA